MLTNSQYGEEKHWEIPKENQGFWWSWGASHRANGVIKRMCCVKTVMWKIANWIHILINIEGCIQCWSDNVEATCRDIWMTSFRCVSIQLRSCLWLRNALPTFKVVRGRTEQTGNDGWLWRLFTEWDSWIHKLHSIALRDASFRRTIRWNMLQRAQTAKWEQRSDNEVRTTQWGTPLSRSTQIMQKEQLR